MNLLYKSLKGFSFGIIAFLVLSAAGAILLKLTPFPESWGFGYCLFMLSILCFFLSFFFSSYFQRAGAICGLLVSLCIIVILFCCVSLMLNHVICLNHLFKPSYGIPLFFGLVGGISGVNLKK